MTAAWLNLLGLARRAGKVAPGENQVTLAMKRQEAKLLIIAHDAGPSLYRKYHLWAQDLDVPLARIETKVTLGHAIGMGPHAVLAIVDEEFAGRIVEEMRKSSGGIVLDRKRERQSAGLRTRQRTQTGQSSTHRPTSSVEGGEHQKPHEHGGARGGKNGPRHHGGQTAAGTQGRTKAGAKSASGSGAGGKASPERAPRTASSGPAPTGGPRHTSPDGRRPADRKSPGRSSASKRPR